MSATAAPVLHLSQEQIRSIDRDLDLVAGPSHPASALKPGVVSGTGAAVAGHDGYLFIADGANLWEKRFHIDKPVVAAFLDGWRGLLDRRAGEAQARGVTLLNLVVPEKQVIYPDKRWPDLASPGAMRPLKQLLAALGPDAPLIYPADALIAARPDVPVFFRHDSHWTPSGCLVAAGEVVAALRDGVDLSDVAFAADREIGPLDLAVHFLEPAPSEERLSLRFGGEIIFDNRDFRPGARLTGMSFGLRNTAAPDPRRLVLFGDSYSSGQGLVAAMSAIFSEVIFVWSKAVDWAVVETHRADIVLWESAERFLVTLPEA
ncbi:MAG: hypothetical protein AB1942_18235 [Pseudomonadota bacterium]